MENEIIKVDEIYSRYGSTNVLKSVSFAVNKGEIITLIGKSGCGKTTLLKSILGLQPINKGNITILDVNMTDRESIYQSQIHKRMGVLYQRGALLNSLTVGENVAIPLEMHTTKTDAEIKAVVKEKLELVELPHAYNKLPTELSGGMIKRAALARAIAIDPAILLCDEPSAGLDPMMTKTIDQLLLTLRKKLNITIVVVTHDILSVERIADRVILLEQGRVVFNGPFKEARISHFEPLREFFLMGREANQIV